jgi:large subunit ribosomal protein L32e
MTQINILLELKSKIKERKPNFIRQDTHKRKKLSIKWRKPKGIHSKIRHHFRGRSKMPSPGYKSPRKVRRLHDSGLKIVLVHSTDDLKSIKKEGEGIIISKTVGMKKRLAILKKAKESNINILNVNVDEQIKKIEDFVNSKKKKEQKVTKKEEVKEKESKTKEQTEKPAELSDEQKKKAEKEEKDKVLTKRV